MKLEQAHRIETRTRPSMRTIVIGGCYGRDYHQVDGECHRVDGGSICQTSSWRTDSEIREFMA